MLFRQGTWRIVAGSVLALILLGGCHGGGHGVDNSESDMNMTAGIGQPSEERAARLQELDDVSAKMYDAVMNGDMLQARTYIRQIGGMITEIEYSGITDVEGVEALTAAIVNAKQLLNAVQAETERVQTAAAQVRLSTDALLHRDHPLWYEQEQAIREATEQLKHSLESGDSLLTSVQLLHRRYAVIRPAVMISRPTEANVKIDSLLAFFMQQAHRPSPQMITNIQELSRAWDELFNRDETAYIPYAQDGHPIYWTLVIGSIILTVLCFVAWRKYQGELEIVSANGDRKR